MQLAQFLQQTFIGDHKIPQIGPGRTATLASYGIETAFDIVEEDILQVPGFKEALAGHLTQWRRSVEAQFRFNAAAGLPPHVQQALDAKYTQARQQVEAALLSGERELKTIAAGAANELRQRYEHIKSSLDQLAQATADLVLIPPGL
jgi:DNA-binding helix-hairpin-helix protein with protein kinase domain